jgi:hypothetical protein
MCVCVCICICMYDVKVCMKVCMKVCIIICVAAFECLRLHCAQLCVIGNHFLVFKIRAFLQSHTFSLMR